MAKDGKKENDMPDQSSGEDEQLDSRLAELDAKLSRHREEEQAAQRPQQGGGNNSGLAMAWRLGSEFISGVLVGGLIGWLVDKWFGVEPWGLIIFILLGFLAGMLNMLRSAGKISPPGG